MTGLPTTRVLLDDGSGAYPYDVTDWVELGEAGGSLTTSEYGRGDEFTQGQAAQLDLTFENVDGSFTSGAGFGLLPFGMGDFGTGANALYPDLGIRVEETVGATTRNRFTGKVESVQLGWPGGTDKFATAEVTAFDALADCARRTLRSVTEEQILAAGVVAYHPLGEAAGASGAGDLAGNQVALTRDQRLIFAGQQVTFGVDLGMVDGATGVTLTQGSTSGNAPGLFKDGSQASTTTPTWTAPSVFLTFVFKQSAPSATLSPLASLSFATGFGSPGVTFDASGHALFNGCTSPTNLMDGTLHVVTVQAGDGASTDMWVDAVKVSTAAVMSNTWNNAGVKLMGGGDAGTATSFAHFAYGPRTTDANVLAIHQAILDGFDGDTPATRFDRLCTYLGVTGVTTVGMSSDTMPAQAMAGGSGLDALLTVATAEGGVLYCNGDGDVVLQGRYYRGMKTSADLTVTADDIGADARPIFDTQQKFDRVTVTRPSGAEQAVGSSNARYPLTLDVSVSSDQAALNRAQWEAKKHADPGKRFGSLTFNLYDSPNAEALLGLEVGDRVSLSSMPAQQWGDVGDVTIEGWVEEQTESSWTLTANVLPWDLFQCAIWDDPGSLWDSAIWGY